MSDGPHYFSNGTEFHAWYANWCCNCARDALFQNDASDHGCPLLLAYFLDEAIPQWFEQPLPYALGDNVHCIDFKPKGFRGGKEPTPQPPPPGQGRLFEPTTGPKMFVGANEQTLVDA